MTHFRGIPVRAEGDGPEEWSALCNRKVRALGPVTTNAWEITCNDCRKILRLQVLKEPEEDRRYR